MLMLQLWLLIGNILHTSWRFVLLPCSIFTSVLMSCQACCFFLFAMLVEAFAWLSQLIHVLVDIIFISVVSCTAHKIVFLTVVMRLITRRWDLILLLILLLVIYFSQRNTIYTKIKANWLGERKICKIYLTK